MHYEEKCNYTTKDYDFNQNFIKFCHNFVKVSSYYDKFLFFWTCLYAKFTLVQQKLCDFKIISFHKLSDLMTKHWNLNSQQKSCNFAKYLQ